MTTEEELRTSKIRKLLKKRLPICYGAPEEAADILIKNATRIENKRDFVLASQNICLSNMRQIRAKVVSF